MKFKYEECHNCYWKYNFGCIRPKGDSCPGRLVAELLAEMDDVKIEPIVIPSQPTTPYEPWRNPYNPYPFGPTVTYADSPNTNETATDGKEHRAYYDAH